MALNKFGEWTRAGIVLRRLNTSLNTNMKNKIKKDAEDLLGQIKTYIEAGMVTPPDASSTLEKKYPENRPWIETYELLDNMKVKVMEVDARRGRYSVFIGVDKDGKTSKRTGVSLNTIAQWLEFGNSDVPPRPVFQPAIEDNSNRLTKSWSKLVGETIAILSKGVSLDVKGKK